MAELDVGSIVLRIRADAAGVQEGLAQLEAAMGQTQAKVQQSGSAIDSSYTRMGQSAQASAAAQAAAAATMAAMAAKAFAVIVGAVDTGIKAMNRYQAALIGVSSVAKGRGIDTADMTASLNQLTDQFFDTAAASTALKNLLSRGYDLDQATQSILNLKNAAAFGRQASLGLAEAVVSATEGLKNENSILVDNAGVTKNVSVMWREYAKSIGASVDNLTTAQKIEAEVAGIRNETRFQTGDLAKLQDTLAGAQAKTAMSGELLARAYGSAMAPAVQVVTEVFGGFLDILTEVVSAAPGLAAGLTGAAVAIVGLMAVQKAVVAFKALSATIAAATAGVTIFGVAINTALPWLAAIGAVLGIATTVYGSYTKAQAEAAEAAKKQAEEEAERKKALSDSVSELTTLRDRYIELSKKTALTYSESEEMISIEKQLQETYGITGGALAKQGEQYDTLTGKINETIRAKLIDLQLDKEKASRLAMEELQFARENTKEAEQKLAVVRQYEQVLADFNRKSAEAATLDPYSERRKNLAAEMMSDLTQLKTLRAELGLPAKEVEGDWEALMASIRETITTGGDTAVTAANAIMAEIAGALRISGAKISEAAESAVNQAFQAIAKADPGINMDAFRDAYADALLNMDISGAVSAMNAVKEKLVSGATPSEADAASVKAGFETIVSFAADVAEALNLSGEQQLALIQSLSPMTAHLATSFDALAGVPGKVIEQWQTQNMAKFISQSAEEMKKSAEEMSSGVQSEISAMGQIAGKLRNEKDIISALRQLKAGFETENAELVKSAGEALTGLGVNAPANLQKAREMLDRRVNIQTDYNMDMLAAYRDAGAMQKEFQGKLDSLVDSGQGDSYMAVKLRSFIAMLEEARNGVGAVFTYQGAGLGEDLKAGIDVATASTKELNEQQQEYSQNLSNATANLEEQRKRMEALNLIQKDKSGEAVDPQQLKAAQDYLFGIIEFAHLAGGSLEDVNASISQQNYLFSGAMAEVAVGILKVDGMIVALKARLAEDPNSAGWIDPIIAGLEQTKQGYENLLNIPAYNQVNAWQQVNEQISALNINITKTQAKLKSFGVTRSQIADTKKLVSEAIRLERAGKDAGNSWRQGVNKALGYEFKGSAKEAAAALDRLDVSLKDQTDAMTAELYSMLDQIDSLANAIITGQINVTVGGSVDASAILAALAATREAISAELISLGMDPLARPDGSRGGGGGGGKKDEGNSAFKAALDDLQHSVAMGRKGVQGELNALLALQKRFKGQLTRDERRDLEKRIYDAREALRQADLQKDLDVIDHKRALNKMSLQAEITALQKILKAHKLNAEERRDINQRIYAAQEALRQERLNKELRRISYLTTLEKMTTAEEIKALEAVLAKHKLTTDERMDLEEQLFAARERLRSDALAWDLALLDHQVAMGKSNTQQEIARLEEIKTLHVLTTEEIMQIDERIYRLQSQRAQDEVGRTKTAYDRIVQALKNRLDEQKKLEDKALDERIEALNELTKAENEAKKTDDYAQNLAEKQRELSVEKSARRRRELTAEIAQMEADEALRLTQLARQEEIDALKAQKDAVSERYAQLTSEENLRQEALRLVMSNNLQEMTDLIASYGNQWQDAGAQLAQALSDGLIGNSSAITDTIQRLNDAIQEGINQQLSTIGRTVPNTLGSGGIVIQLYGTTIREDADIDMLANEMYARVQAAGR